MKKKDENIVVFPVPAPHKLNCMDAPPSNEEAAPRTGGIGGVEIKHTHPEHQSQEERAERLKELRRTCAALVRVQREKAEQRRKRSA